MTKAANALSLQARLARVQLVIVLAFLVGATVFCYRMATMDDIIEQHFAIAARVDEAAERAVHMGASQAEVVHTWTQLRRSAVEVERRYRSERISAAMAWSVILVLPLVMTFWPMRLSRSIVGAIGLLGRKVQAGLVAGDSTSVKIERRDEIGILGAAIDDMFADLHRRQVEARLARHLELEQQRLTDMVSLTGGIAHEVANPLSVILANLDCIEGVDGHACLSFSELDRIREGLQRIQDLLRDVTAFSAGDDGIGLVDVNAVASAALRIVRLDDRLRGNSFTANLDPSLPAVEFSRPVMTLAVFSLLSLGSALLRDARGTVDVTSLGDVEGVELRITVAAATQDDGGDPRVPALTELAKHQTLQSLVRVMRSMGGELVLYTMETDALDIRLRFPLHKGEAARV
ncbi:MAG: HAMP domain-containing histidine kinase [Rhodospirillaceae bacterium]|nr:HAMP domain-containing histidine kinase [Rhodospirillales bacterium]